MVDFLHHNRLDGMTRDILQVRVTAPVINYGYVKNVSFVKLHAL